MWLFFCAEAAGLFLFENSDNERFRGKKPEVLRMILRSYARHISTEALRDLYIVEDMQAWNPGIRSKTSIRSTPTRHFVDTSIACMALSIGPEDLKRDLPSFGLFFEDFAVRDLSVYVSLLRGEVRHYRDNAGLECDAVIHLEDGRWGAVEIKLGGDDLVEAGACSLKKLRAKIEEKSDKNTPSFLLVLTAVGPAYRREDGVFVAPINLLRQ
jgi:uncharacterized protein